MRIPTPEEVAGIRKLPLWRLTDNECALLSLIDSLAGEADRWTDTEWINKDPAEGLNAAEAILDRFAAYAPGTEAK